MALWHRKGHRLCCSRLVVCVVVYWSIVLAGTVLLKIHPDNQFSVKKIDDITLEKGESCDAHERGLITSLFFFSDCHPK